jgi:hypothetical protein
MFAMLLVKIYHFLLVVFFIMIHNLLMKLKFQRELNLFVQRLIQIP